MIIIQKNLNYLIAQTKELKAASGLLKPMIHKEKNTDGVNPNLNKENRISSEVLMSGKRELTIIHNNEEYKLRLTGNGKLILTK